MAGSYTLKRCLGCKAWLSPLAEDGNPVGVRAYKALDFCSVRCSRVNAKAAQMHRPQSWARTREDAFEHYGRFCQSCGDTSNIHVHHKDENPKNNNIDNLHIICGPCHVRHHHKSRESFRKGPVSKKERKVLACQDCGAICTDKKTKLCDKCKYLIRYHGTMEQNLKVFGHTRQKIEKCRFCEFRARPLHGLCGRHYMQRLRAFKKPKNQAICSNSAIQDDRTLQALN